MPKVALVGSVKGGTGKTLFSINLALELHRRGHSVALIDADISSSYFKRFTKADIKIESDKEYIKLANWNGIKVFSMSLLDTGPISMYGFSERQILNDVYNYADWREAEYVIIDLPAGAEDVFKEVLRLWARELVGMYVVMIPFAEQSARQLIELARYYEVPILGLVENMAYVSCKHCLDEINIEVPEDAPEEVKKIVEKIRDEISGAELYPFGTPVGYRLAQEYKVTYLGQIPLDPRIAANIEQGKPVLPEDIIAPVREAANIFEKSMPGGFWETWRKRFRSYVQTEVVKLLAKAIIAINKNFDIKGIKDKYGFVGGKPFAIIVVDDNDKPVAVLNLKLKKDRLVVVKGRVKPVWVIEIPVRTLIDIVRGYREVNGMKLAFDAKKAWELGELKIYGPGSTPMALYVIDKLLSNPEIVGQARQQLGGLLALVG